MLISVIMANYNGERYLGEAIESVLMQTYQDFEFIIVEDASTDGSRKVIENYHRLDEDRIKPIYGHENRGQGACFNIGVQLSKGNVICFLDSDDLWFTAMISGLRTNLRMFTTRFNPKINFRFTSTISI